MLRDLEELLLSVPDSQSRAYMREAVMCYNGAAYRASVVIGVAAGMDDLRRKLQSLASTGGASASVKDAHKAVDALFRSQDTFESILLDKALKIDLITPAEEAKLRILLQTRHLCGHPSGHAGTAEEARSTIAAVVDLILSRPTVLGMSAVDQLVSRVARKAFFPNKAPDSARQTCQSELRVVSPTLFPALIERMIKDILECTALRATSPLTFVTSNEAEALENLTLFFAAIITMDALRHEVWKRLGQVIEDENSEDCCLDILAASDGPGIMGTQPLNRLRALALVRRNLSKPSALAAAKTWLGANTLDPNDAGELRMACRDFARSHSVADAVSFLALPDAESIKMYIQRLVDDADSTTFSTANDAIVAMQSLTEEQAKLASVEQQVAYVLNIASHGPRTYKANRATELLTSGLGPRASFCNAIRETFERDPKSILNGTEDFLIKLLRASGRPEVAEKVDAARASTQLGNQEQE